MKQRKAKNKEAIYKENAKDSFKKIKKRYAQKKQRTRSPTLTLLIKRQH